MVAVGPIVFHVCCLCFIPALLFHAWNIPSNPNPKYKPLKNSVRVIFKINYTIFCANIKSLLLKLETHCTTPIYTLEVANILSALSIIEIAHKIIFINIGKSSNTF
jgi:hypothetical protein